MRKTVAYRLVVVALFIMVGLGAAFYLRRPAKPQSQEARSKIAPLGPVTAGDKAGANPVTAGSEPEYPEWQAPKDRSQPFADGKIPLQPGLTVVTAIAQPLVGDYESIKRIETSTDSGVRISFSADLPNVKLSGITTNGAKPAPSTQRRTCVRTVQRQDMQGAHEYRENFCVAQEEKYPGTTAISVSAQVLAELKTKGEASFKYQSSALNSGPPDASCVLKRVEAADLAVPILVNDRRIQVPAVHAKCRPPFYDEAEFYLLDDPDNPLSLAWQLGENRLQVVKITVPAEGPRIEQSLSQAGRAEVHGIYFDFASATIRPESEPVLKEIAQALVNNPQWKLSVEGHTDNVGGDDYNLELSNRRAAAVKQALVEQFHVPAERLGTTGFGASRPRETNDTLEGRARNRRVELVRQ